VAAAWNAGWQPTELARQVRRTADAITARLALVAISADHAARAPSTLDPRWIAQLTELHLPAVTASAGWIEAWARGERLPWPATIRAAVALVDSLATIAPLPILIPPPGARTERETIIDLTAHSDDPILKRVRALLAQAESTTYEAEAESFTAKAQELMTRHAIDAAMLATDARRSERPGTIRIPIDEPYVNGKSLFLHVVAASSRCRAVFHPRFAMSSVIGFGGDLAATETLFTSLLIQAQVAMHASTKRSRSFRSAFLLAYANRIAERLAEINAHVVADAEAETGRSILPVLAARSSLIDETMSEMFGRVTTSARRRDIDAEGWESGRRAADRARLNTGEVGQPGATPRLSSVLP
jgi:hypothetical protein